MTRRASIALAGVGACVALGLTYSLYDPLAPQHDAVDCSSWNRIPVPSTSPAQGAGHRTRSGEEPCAKCNGAPHSGPVDIIAAGDAAQSAVDEIMALNDILVLAPPQYDGYGFNYGDGLAGDFRGGPFRSVVFVDHDGFIGSVWFLDTPITNAVPEPSAWLMMLTGFGFIGVMLRSKRLRERRHER